MSGFLECGKPMESTIHSTDKSDPPCAFECYLVAGPDTRRRAFIVGLQYQNQGTQAAPLFGILWDFGVVGLNTPGIECVQKKNIAAKSYGNIGNSLAILKIACKLMYVFSSTAPQTPEWCHLD
jgi:hypothetical protein